ncbi:right-handed parallel beta-helix repeat-containing protein [Paenarthrobacter sp. NEAU-H11]|uniref:right-handed parallel beta-helix repeat-containing protein n=1 Tax=Paenarthrobacter sp. NEAU-H11 TaxID=3423924 RepID=UPI003D33C868
MIDRIDSRIPREKDNASIQRRKLLGVGALAAVTSGITALFGPNTNKANAASGEVEKTNLSTQEVSTYLTKWKPETGYGAGETVVSPSGDVVLAKSAFVSGSTYNPTNWQVSTSARLGNDPLDFGASATADSASAFVAASSSSKTIRLRPGATYRIASEAVLQPGTVLEGNGATIQLLLQGHVTASDNCTIKNISFVTGNTVGFVGGERAVTVRGSNVLIECCQFIGQNYRHGVVIERPNGGSCDNCTIRHNKFSNIGYGILKQGGPIANPCTAHFLAIHDNTFKTVRRGDAIELNAGADHDILIASNIIDDVTAGTLNYAGFGIAVAGLSGYSSPEADRLRRCLITNNIVTNVERTAIHAEVAARIEIRNNHIEQTATNYEKIGTGIAIYGSINCTIQSNSIYNFNTGILDGIGYINGENIISTDKNRIRDNDITYCIVGISEGVAGEGKTAHVERNTLTSCTTGIKQFGAASGVYYTANTLVACSTALNIDANPAAKLSVAANNRRINLKDNQIFTLDSSNPSNVFSNLFGTTVTGDGNNFNLPV